VLHGTAPPTGVTYPGAMRVAFTCVPAYGHLHPVLPVAVAFASAGDEVVVATGTDLLSSVEAAGLIPIADDQLVVQVDALGVVDHLGLVADSTGLPRRPAGGIHPVPGDLASSVDRHGQRLRGGELGQVRQVGGDRLNRRLGVVAAGLQVGAQQRPHHHRRRERRAADLRGVQVGEVVVGDDLVAVIGQPRMIGAGTQLSGPTARTAK
jgi:hypothetical protein